MAEKSRNWVAVLNTLHQSDKLNRVSEGAELLYRRLLEVVDNGGNYFADPHLLLGYVFAHRMSRGLTPKDMLDRTQELVGVGLVDVYADGKLLHISRYYTRLRSDRHGADIRFDPFPGPTDPTPDSDRTPPGVRPDSNRRPQNRDRIESEIDSEKRQKRIRTCADESNSSAPPSATTSSSTSEPEPKPRERTYCQQVVDLLLSKWAKVYEQTRGQAYPGDVQKGHGVVTGALPRLVKDFPTTKAKAAALTAEQRREFSAKAVKTWAGFLERAEMMHKLSAETPGKDARFMLFPDSPARFVGRMPSLSWRDVQAASKRVQDVKEAKRNTERMRHGD